MEIGNVCKAEIVENNGNKTKGRGGEGTEGEDIMKTRETDGIVIVTVSSSL